MVKLYRKNRFLVLILSLILVLVSFTTPVSAISSNEVVATIPKTDIKIDGEVIDNQHNKYPMLTYKGVTYLPLTWDYCNALGLEKSWHPENGLKLSKNNNFGTPNQDLSSNNDMDKNYTVQRYDSDVFINGSKYTNEDYPFLMFRQIIYLPLTYEINTALGISVKWDKDSGIEIVGKKLVITETENNEESTETESNEEELPDKSLKELVNLSESVALIEVYDEMGRVKGIGSGVAIDDEGLIVTNYHVIEQGRLIGVLFEGMDEQDKYYTLNILGLDVERDLAIIKVDAETKPINIGDSDTLSKGDEVVAIGNPLGFSNSISDGIVSGIRDLNGTEFIQMTTPVSPGSSGGALINMKGELVGITTLMFVDGQNVNFAVPSKYVKELLNDDKTQLNINLLNKVEKFNYGAGYITFETFNYDHYGTYMINLYSDKVVNLDSSEIMNDEEFKQKFKSFLVSKVGQTAREYGIEEFELNAYLDTHSLSFKYDNGLVKDIKWTEYESVKEGVLNVGLGGFVQGFDPQYFSDAGSFDVINNIYEGLMREVNGEIKPGMAESYTISSDGTTYTFKIRDTKWSDGKPVTASDFEYSWKRALDPLEAYFNAPLLYVIQGAENYYKGIGSVDDVAIEAIDDKTLKVTLNSPTPYFLSLTTQPIFMPVRKDIIEEYGYYWDSYVDALVSNGPYKISEFEYNEPIVIVKNEEYYNSDAIHIDKINIYEISDTISEGVSYLTGKVDVLENMSSLTISALKQIDEELVEATGDSIYFLKLNISKNPINNAKVRKALSLAINRETITEDYYLGQRAAAAGLVPNGTSLSDGTDFREKAGDYEITVDEASIAEAKKLLTEAGYSDPSKLPEIEITCAQYSYDLVNVIKEMWEENLGIDVRIKALEVYELFNNIDNGDYVVALLGWRADANDPIQFFKEGIVDYSTFNNEELEKLLDQSNESSGAERDEMLLEVEKIIMDNMYVIPLYHNINFTAVNSSVEGLEKTSEGYLYFGNTKLIE